MSDLTDQAERLPWVKRLRDPVKCDGIKWSTVALRDLFAMGSNPPRGLKPESYCKAPALWSFTALQRSDARSGSFCWSHLVYAGLNHNPMEAARCRRWFEKNPEEGS